MFVKRDDGQGAEQLVATKDGAGEQVDRLGEIDSGNPQTVVDFVRWSIAQAPADRYALVLDGAGFTKIVVQRYVESYKTEDGVWPITQCAIAADGIERISGALDDLSGSLRAELRENWPQLMTAQTNAVRFLVDLATLCERLAESSSLSAETRSAAAAVQHALEPDGYARRRAVSCSPMAA